MPLPLIQGILGYSPFVFFSAIFLAALVFFFERKGRVQAFRARMRVLLFSAIGFRLLYAAAATVAQYLLWARDPATRAFVESGIGRDTPIAPGLAKFPFLFGKGGYFLFYSYGRFWLSALVAIFCVLAFWWFLKLLRKWKERFFEEGEITLGALMVALVGWPGFVVFLPFVLVSIILVSLFRLAVLKQELTTMGAPFLLAAFIVLLYGQKLVALLGLSVLKI